MVGHIFFILMYIRAFRLSDFFISNFLNVAVHSRAGQR